MRADKLQFNIAYKDFAYTENASKLRVFCYMKNGGYAFGDEFSDLTSATFDSTRTAKYSGYGTITIQLIDAEENLINSANVICKIIESNSTTPFVSSPDFAQESKREIQAIVDNGKSQIEEATKKAKEEIDNWTDQSQRLADTEADISALQMFKANSGALHFSGGNAQCSGLANKPIPNINTIAFRWKCDASTFENIPVSQRIVGYVGSWYHLARINGGLQLYVKYTDGQQYIGLTESNIITLLTDGNWHNVAIISTGTTFDFAIDGKILKSVARSKTTDFAIPTSNFIVSYSTTNIGSIADVFIFNFDITSEDALYTIADYQQGKPIPPKAFEYLNQNVAELPIDENTRNGLSDMSANQISHCDRAATISVSGNAITWTAKTTQTGYPRAIVYKFAKALTGSGFLKVNVGNISKIGNFDTMRIAIFDSAGTILYPSGTGFGFNKGPLSLSIPYENGLSAIAIGTGSSWSKDDSFTIDYLKVEHNGTILALENYTIANGTSGSKIIFDYSGNGNDATITGDVKGDNDNRVQKLIDFIKS